MKESKLSSENFECELIDKHIIYIFIKDFMELEKEDILRMQNWLSKQTKEKRIFNLIQFGNGSSASREAREYAASPEGNKNTVGSALIVKNLAQQLIIDYYLKFNHPIKPTQSFYKKDKAISWIKDQLIKN